MPNPEAFPSAPSASVGILADPRTTVERLLKTDDENRVRAVMRSLSPEQAADLLDYAPTPHDKAKLLKAMERRHRAETLDHVAPALFATLVENRDTQTDYLLGEVSIDRFSELLTLCSPEQRFYWVARAAAHDDGAAQLLTLLLPPKDLAEMLLTVPEFRRSFQHLRTYEPGQFEKVPTRDARLGAVLQFLSDFDTELYKEVFLAARNMLDWEHVNREVTEAFIEAAPIAEFEKYEAPDPEFTPSSGVNLAGEPAADPLPDDVEPADALELVGLARQDAGAIAASGLSAERFAEIQEDLDAMIQREIVDAGGSFAPDAIEQATGRVHCYLHYGLIRLGSAVPSRMARLLADRPLISIINAGMEYLEALRQRALRINYLREWLDKEQVQLLDGMLRPRAGVMPGSSTEYVFRLEPHGARKDERLSVRIDDVRLHLEELQGWAFLAQKLPPEWRNRIAASTSYYAQAYLGAVAVAVTLYRRWEPSIIDVQDVYDFRDRMVNASGELTEAAEEVLAGTAEKWSRAQGMTDDQSGMVAKALEGAGNRLAAWLLTTPRPKPPQCRNWVYLKPDRRG